MSDDESRVLEFRAEKPGAPALLLPFVPGVLVLLALVGLVRALAPPGPWQGRGFVLVVAVAVLAALLFVLRRQRRRAVGLTYALTDDALEIRSQTETVDIPYSDVTRIVEAVSPFRVRASVEVTARGRRYVLAAENHTLLVERLAGKSGAPAESPSYLLWSLRRGWAAGVLVLLAVCLVRALARLSLVASAGMVAFGAAAAANIVTGRLERCPGRAGRVRRTAYGAVVLVFFAGLGAAGIVGWQRSFVRALDVSAWSRPLARALVVEDIPRLSFEVPPGWKVGTSRGGGRTWIVLRGGASGGGVILVVASAQLDPNSERDFWRFGNLAQESVRAALEDYGRRESENPGDAESFTIGNAVWLAFTDQSILHPGRREVTYWQASGRTAFSITVEEGDLAGPAAAALLASFVVREPLERK